MDANNGQAEAYDLYAAMNRVAGEFPNECGCMAQAAALVQLNGTGARCDPTQTNPPQLCPGGSPCPNCGSNSCECSGGGSPSVTHCTCADGTSGVEAACKDGPGCCSDGSSNMYGNGYKCRHDAGPAPSPSSDDPVCGRSAAKCPAEQCAGYYHAWGCVGSCGGNMACQGQDGDWSGCDTCANRVTWVMDANNGQAEAYDLYAAMNRVAGEFPNECGCMAQAAALVQLNGTGARCDPTQTNPPQLCPGGSPCPNCGSNSCECSGGGSPSVTHCTCADGTSGVEAACKDGPGCC